MGKATKKTSPAKRKKMDPEKARLIRRGLEHLSLALALACVLGAGVYRMRQYVDRNLAFPTAPPKVVLKNRPAWMSDFLAEQIIRMARPIGLHSAYDHQLLVDTYDALRANPWIKDVKQVRRAYDQRPGDTLEIDCDYRAPVALVRWGEYYWLVDGDGVKLPEQYTLAQLPRIVTGRDGKLNIRIIDGVSHAPVESGNRWPGADVAAALEMIKLLSGQPFTEEITKVDVSNFAGRREARDAQVVLWTKYVPPTQIRWGRPPGAPDAFIEVSAAQKMATLKSIYDQFHRIDGAQPWIDIRFDRVTCPKPVSPPPPPPPPASER